MNVVVRKYWSRTPGKFLDQNTGLELLDAPTFNAGVEMWNCVLSEYINDVANTIKNQVADVPVSVFCTSAVATILTSTPFFSPNKQVTDVQKSNNAYCIGKINFRLNLFIDHDQAPNQILLTNSLGESGIVEIRD